MGQNFSIVDMENTKPNFAWISNFDLTKMVHTHQTKPQRPFYKTQDDFR